MQKLSKNQIEIIGISFLSIFSLLIWESSWVFPIKMFVVLIHEFSHGIMTIITGGNVQRIIFNLDLSGITESSGGNLILIAAAGYPGSLIIGSLLFLSSDNIRLRKWITNGLGAVFIIMGINFVQGGLQIFLCLTIASVFLFVPRFFNETTNRILLRFIGLTSCLYVIADIKQDLLTVTLRETDTQIIEYLTNIPSMVIGSAWFLISVLTAFYLINRVYKD